MNEHHEEQVTPSEAEDDAGLPASGEMLERDPMVGPAPIASGRDAQVVALDWFGEGRLDLLVSVAQGGAGRRVLVYPALAGSAGEASVYGEGQVVEQLAGFEHLSAVPGASGGRFDLVGLHHGCLYAIRNEAEAGPPRFQAPEVLIGEVNLGIGPGRVAQLSAQDWDGDGKVDLLVGFDDLTDYWSGAPGIPEAQQVGVDVDGHHVGYDQRGHWRGGAARGRLFWLRNVGEAGQLRFEAPVEVEPQAVERLGVDQHPAFLVASWGHDRTAELMLCDESGKVRLHRNFGGQLPPMLMDPRPLMVGKVPLRLGSERVSVQLADVDGDGGEELLYSGWDGRIFAIHAGTGRDQAEPPVALTQHSPLLAVGGGAVIAAADLDADGDVDLIVGDGPGRLWMVEDLGGPRDHRYGSPLELESGGMPFHLDPGRVGRVQGPASLPLGFTCPTIVDWKQNDRPDLIVSSASGEVLFLRNNGGKHEPRFDRPEPLQCEHHRLIIAPRVRPAVASWLKPGELPDLIALDLEGLLCVFPREGVLEVGDPLPLLDPLGRALHLDGSYGQAGRCCLWAGPWTGSGRLDLLVGLPRGNRHVVPALTGRPLESVDDLPTVLLLENLGEGIMLPRHLRLADGSPVVVGEGSCSPCGVDWRGEGGALDLLVGSDEGRVHFFRREDLRW